MRERAKRRNGAGSLALSALVALAASASFGTHACAPREEPVAVPTNVCGFDVWYKAASPRARIEVVGSWNDFRRPGVVVPHDRNDGWRFHRFELPEGEYRYFIVDDGTELANPYVPTTAEVDGRETSWVDVKSCTVPTVRVESVESNADGTARIRARYLASPDSAPLDPDSIALVARDGSTRAIQAVRVREEAGSLELDLEGLPKGKHVFTLQSRDKFGRAATSPLVTLWIEAERFVLEDSVIYQIMVDRFANEAGALAQPELASGRAGGTLRGITRAIQAGRFEALGANTLWLSPLYRNPTGLFSDGDGNQYSSYHGYWPIASRELEPLLGSEADFEELVATAHARALRVVVDVVPNHVHQEHPRWRDRTSDRGFNRSEGTCICGTPDCGWAEHIRECWFAPYMPDLDWNQPDVARLGVDDVAWWIERFDTDGIRIDAVPMMPRSATRRIVEGVRTRFEHAGHPMLMLGENFTGPGGYDLLRYQLGPFGLDSQFNFPLMWALRGALAEGAMPMSAVADAVATGERAWAGSGAVMATMIGNHDVTRFLSVADGTDGGNGWTPAPSPTSKRAYEKQRLALASVFTLPGAPVLFYGDEVGLPGRRDPDSRRVMPSEASLDTNQRETLEFTQALGRLRAACPVLRRGSYRLIDAGAESWSFVRETAEGAAAIIVLNRSPATDVEVPLDRFLEGRASFPNGTTMPEAWTEALTGRHATLRPELTKFGGAPFSAQVWLPAATPCSFSPPRALSETSKPE